MSDWIYAAPLLCVVLGGLAMMLVDAFIEEKSELATTTAVILIGASGISAALWYGGYTNAPSDSLLAGWLATDKLSLVSDVIIAVGAALAALIAGGYLREHELERGEFYPLLLFSAFGAMVLARSVDLLSVFIGLETMSLGVYTLVAFRRTSARAAEGAIKYFLLGSFAAALLLLGSAYLYGATGHTDFAGIAQVIQSGGADSRLVLLALMLIIVGLAFKVSAVPFHMWTPDAYEGAITPVTTFMSVCVKSAVFVVMVRVFLVGLAAPELSSSASGWPPILAGLAALTMVFGNLGAVVQTSVKRMLAYSSIAHAGYILIGLVAAAKIGEQAISAVLYYLAAYTVSNALAFGALVFAGSRQREAVSYEDLAGLGRRNPILAIPFLIAILSLMGFPPTAGFFAKYYVFMAAVQAGGGMVWLAVLGAMTSVVGTFYYLRVLVFLFMREPAEGARVAIPMRSGYVITAMVVAGVLVLQMGVAPGGYLDIASAAAKLFT
ncbi:MAG: NADH-ubiquinone oxidoreductase chain [Myxococcaceae bacterium]|nr:NADH-ubiquinone oxidoreductase chain [Myxococcaceae bacterium]